MTRRYSIAVRVVVVVVLAAAALVSNPVAQPRRRPGVARLLETVNGRRAAAAEVLVKFRRPLAEFERGQIDQQTDADQQDAIGSTGVRRLHSRRFTAQALLDFLRNHPDVEYAEPNYLIEADAVPNDGMFNQLWGLLNVGQVVGVAGTPGADISATSAWDITTGSTANVVAVIDTGIDYSHVDLSQNVWSAPATFNVTIGGQTITCDAGTHGFNAILKTCDPADDNGHGTHVSGTIGARGNNGIGVAGVNWTTRIMASKFLDANGVGTTADAINALEFVIQAAAATGANVRVLSNSWSSGGFSQALLDVITKANGRNMLFVASAGNNATSNDTTPRFPANYGAAPYNAPNVIAVASTKSNDALAGTSNFGTSSVHLAAPGEIILSTVPFDISGTEYQYLSGTSMAVPHVAGAAMLVLSRCALTTTQLKDDLLATVDPIPALNGVVLTGGRLNVNAALRACLPDFSLTAPSATKTTQPGTSTGFGINVSSTGGFTGAVSFTVNGLPSGATASFEPASVTSPGSTLMTVAPNTSVPAGSYPLTVTGTSGSLVHTVAVTLVISGTTTTTTVASDANPSIYGSGVTFTALASGSGTLTGTVTFKDGSTVLGSAAVDSSGHATFTTSSLAAGSHSITASYDGDARFSGSTSTTLSQVVNKAPLTVTADNKSRGYGGSNPTLTASFAGFRNGETLATSGVTGAPTLTTTATGTTAVGSYPIAAAAGTLASANYTFTFVNGSLSVTAAPLTVTADSKSRGYGDANPTFSASFSGFKNGETLATGGITGAPSLTTTAVGSSAVGSYPIVAAAGTLASTNYTFTFANGSLSVTAAPLTVAADNKSRGYGDANPIFTASFGGFRNGETLATSGVTGAPSLTTTAVAGSAAGSYPIAVAAGTLASTNYTFTFVNGSLTITRAALAVTADNQSRGYGDANPTFTASFSGFKNGETLATSGVTGAPTLTTTATAGSAPGSYPIAVVAGALASANYTFTFVNGTLTINKAALIVTADNKSRVYGDGNPTLTASFSGFKNGETLATSGVTGTPGLTTIATGSSGAGSYPIAVAAGTLASANYSFTFVSGSLTVSKAALSIAADNQLRGYGDANPSFTATYSGFRNNETVATSGVTGAPSLTTTAIASSIVGSYPITVAAGTLASANYTFAFVNGSLQVTAAPLTVTADNKARGYGTANPTLSASLSGFRNGEAPATSGVTGTPSLTTTATAGSVVGSYPITVAAGTLASTNYTFTFASGTLSVTPAVLTVTANDQTRAYGAANPALTMSYSGFVNGDTAASLTTPPTVTTTATTASGVGTYPITASGAVSSNANYTITYASGTLTVTPAALTITATNKTRTYGVANPALTVSYSGFVNGDTPATLTTPPTVTTTATVSSGVGTYPITASGAVSSNANYAVSYVSGTLTVTPAALTVTATNKTRTYGAANPAFTASFAGFVNGDTAASLGGTLVVSTTATAGSPVGTYPITPSGLTSSNYTISYVNGTLTVTAAVLTIAASDQTKAYGAVNPALTVSYSGFVNGDTAASLTTPPSVTTTATTASGVGAYPITASGAVSSNANYTITYASGTLTVTPAALTVTGTNKTRTYGAPNPAFPASFAGFVNGDTAAALGGTLVVSTTATASSSVGTYPITPSGLTSSNYAITYVHGTLTVTAAVLTIAANDQTRAYGAVNPALTVSYSGFVNGDTAASLTTPPTVTTPATTASGVGTYPITASGAVSSNSNYAITYASGTLTVTPAALTVTATNKTRTYGAPNPAFTAGFTGLVGGDTVSSLGGTLTFTTTATASSVVGTYAITPSGLTSSNYAIAYVNGTLTVTSAVLTIAASDQTKAYGAVNPALTVSYSGFVNGDTAASLTTPPSVTTTATTASGVGAYPITASGAVSSNANYTISYASGTLTVTTASLTVTATNKTRTYGAANPAFSASFAGFVNGDTAASLGGTLVVSTTATSSSPVGSYPITPAGLTSSNYTITYADGTLTVTPAALTVTATNKARTYGAPNPAFTANFSGLVGGDTVSSLGGTLTFSTTATASSPVGTYAITPSGLTSGNYTISYVNGTLTVTAAVLTIAASDQTKAYGAVNPALTVSYSGFVNGDTAASLTTPPTVTTTATTASGVGTYPITASGAVSSNANYTITYASGTLTVTPAALTVTGTNKTRTYGAPNPAFTASFAGFVNGDTAASLGGTLVVSTTATASSPVGTYPITPSGLASTNYTISYLNGTLTVTSAVLTITANDQTRAYGAVNPPLTVSYSGFVNGDTAASLTTQPTVTTTATAASGVGTYPISAGGAVSSNSNYTISYASGTLTVTPATLTVTAANKTRTYAAANPSFTASFAGFVNGDTVSSLGGTLTFSTTATASSPVGTYAITPSGLTSSNYTISYVNGTLTVTAAVLTIAASDQTKAYGAVNPALTVSYSGFVNGDTAASLATPPSVTTTATTASGVGTYPITASGAVSANSNYTITYAIGTLTVTPAALTVTGTNKTRTYGAPNPAFTASFAGFVNGDTAASLGGTLAFSTTATSSSPVGSYAIMPAGLTSGNYAIGYADGTLTVTPAALTVTADNKSRGYGTTNPTLIASFNGFQNGETLATGGVTGTPSLTTTATPSSAVGSYPITVAVGTLASTNYTFTFVNGSLSVTSAVLTITANDQTKAYGAVNPALTVSYNGFVNGDTPASLTTQPTVTTTAAAASGVGTYPITASGAVSSNANYTISYASGTLTVTAAALTVTATNKTRTYGASTPAFTASFAGFVNGDTAASLVGTLTFTTTATSSSPVGSYAITPAGITSSNYAINFVNGTLTITSAALTITANDQTRTYGAANPALTVSYSGFVNGDTAASLTTAPAVTTTATAGSGAGTYPITASGASSANYDISYVNGSLIVTQAPLTITATNQTKAAGTPNPPLTVTYSGFVNGDTAADLTTQPTVTTTATTSSPAGTYPITASGAASPNYAIAYVNGTLTITGVGGGGGGPVANDNNYATTKGTSLLITAPGVLGNDTGGAQSAVLVSGPGHGTLTLNTSGSFRYTPSLNYVGTDTFRYQARDSNGNLSNVATVTIMVSQISAVLGPGPSPPPAR